MFQLRPDDTRDLDEALFAAIDALTVKDTRGNLCIANLPKLQAAARAVTESGQPCDWQKAGTKLWSRLVRAKNASYTHYDRASDAFLEWGKFIAISEHELSSTRARDSRPILDAISSLNRFYLVLGRDSKRPSAAVYQTAARGVDSGESSEEDTTTPAPPSVLAVKPSPAPGGKGRGKNTRATDTAVSCWTPSCKATVQPHWNTCLACNCFS